MSVMLNNSLIFFGFFQVYDLEINCYLETKLDDGGK